jgi:hypothetical protein
MTRGPLRAIVLGAAAGGVLAPALAGTQARGSSQARIAEDALEAASGYVEAYRKDAAFLIADETYMQTRLDADGRAVETREMRGELFLTYLEGDGAWIAVHDVAEVDGAPVPDREDLIALLQRGAALRGVAARVAASNARFNLGRISRNFNEPTLPLLLLEPERVRRLDASLTRTERRGDQTLVTLAFEERGRPTLVRSPTRPIASTGEFVIDPATGRVHRTRFALRQDAIRAELVTTYEHDERLDIWVPRLFTERYEGRVDGARETIECEARYTNYRRFTALARIR